MVSGTVSLFSVGGPFVNAVRVFGVCDLFALSLSCLGKSVLGSSLHWAVEGPCRAATAAAAAAPAFTYMSVSRVTFKIR